MDGHRTRNLLPLLFMVTLITGCTEIVGEEEDLTDRLYLNSFESASDTAGWHGYGGMQIQRSAPAGGGQQSVRIAGGCIHPHASIDIVGPPQDCNLLLQCWGRNLANGGTIVLRRTRDLTKGLYVAVADTTWTFYQSGGTLFCPKGDSLQIEMSAGGIIPSAMLVDLLEIRMVR